MLDNRANHWEPGKLWSLWDLMEEFRAGDLLIYLRSMRSFAENVPQGGTVCVPPPNWDDLVRNTQLICDELETIGLPVTLDSAQSLLKVVKEEFSEQEHGSLGKVRCISDLSLSRYQNFSKEVIGRFRSELSSRKIVSLNASESEIYADERKIFSGDAIDAFPSIEPEAQEAAKCFALGRYTAGVFHAVRALESGLNALAAELGVDIQSNWNNALNLIEKEIRSRSKSTHGQSWVVDEQFYSEAATHFRFFKNAWRNHTMHIKERYDEKRARTIIIGVADFMAHLSSRIRE